MGIIGKIIGGGLGWALGGPIGAILGVAFGSLVDNATNKDSSKNTQTYRRHHTQPNDFAISLIILTASVMKADGKVLKSELEFVKQYLTRSYGEHKTTELLKSLRDVLKKEVNVREVCLQIRYYMEHPMRLQLLHFLFGIAQADGDIHAQELQLIKRISTYLGISHRDYESIKAMFLGGGNRRYTSSNYTSASDAYSILGISSTSTDDEAKKAYRKMAIKYHPDKVSTAGEEVKNAAKEKMRKINEAYEIIKKERGIK